MPKWIWQYEGHDPSEEPLRESLCTLGDGYFTTRGATPESKAAWCITRRPARPSPQLTGVGFFGAAGGSATGTCTQAVTRGIPTESPSLRHGSAGGRGLDVGRGRRRERMFCIHRVTPAHSAITAPTQPNG